MSKKQTNEIAPAEFSKEQLVQSKMFVKQADILSVLVADNEKITIKEATERIKTYMKGKVK